MADVDHSQEEEQPHGSVYRVAGALTITRAATTQREIDAGTKRSARRSWRRAYRGEPPPVPGIPMNTDGSYAGIIHLGVRVG